jgi:hypothetical protein
VWLSSLSLDSADTSNVSRISALKVLIPTVATGCHRVGIVEILQLREYPRPLQGDGFDLALYR